MQLQEILYIYYQSYSGSHTVVEGLPGHRPRHALWNYGCEDCRNAQATRLYHVPLAFRSSSPFWLRIIICICHRYLKCCVNQLVIIYSYIAACMQLVAIDTHNHRYCSISNCMLVQPAFCHGYKFSNLFEPQHKTRSQTCRAAVVFNLTKPP